MTSEPLPAECAEMQRRLAEDDSGQEVLGHLAECGDCTAYAAALVEIEARLVQLPLPAPPAGAADRAIARFRAELAMHATPGTAPLAKPLTPATPPTTLPSSPGSTSPPPAPPRLPTRTGQERMRRWRRPAALAAGLAAAIALVVALVVVLGPARTPPGYAAILREAATRTAAEQSARFGLTGDIGLSVRGQRLTAVVSGTGSSEFPDRGELTEVVTLHGRPLLQQDVVSVGNRVWTRNGGGPWTLVPPEHASAIAQALANPARALGDLSRVGSGYRSLGAATVGGTRVRQIRLTIPGGSFDPFGSRSEKASRWTVVADISQDGLVLRRLTITGHGVVSEFGTQAPFTYDLQLTLHDFGTGVSIEPPGSRSTPQCGHCKPGHSAASPTATPGARVGIPPGSSPSPSSGSSPGSSPSPSTGPSSNPAPSSSPSPRPTSSAPAPSPTPSRTAQPSPTPTSSCPPPAAGPASPAVAHKDCTAPPTATR